MRANNLKKGTPHMALILIRRYISQLVVRLNFEGLKSLSVVMYQLKK